MWFLGICLVLNTFLIMLNGYLRGRLKPWIDVLLGGVGLLVIVLFFVFFGWKIGVCSIIGTFLVGAILKPLAARTAGYLLHRRF